MSGRERWYILGAGAIGTATCQRLQSAGIDACLLHHGAHAATRQLRTAHGAVNVPAVPVSGLACGAIRRLLVTTKAGQVSAALNAARSQLAPRPVVLVTANGLGFERGVIERFPDIQLYRGVSTAAAYREGGQRFVSAARGRTWVGATDIAQSAPEWFSDSLGQLREWEWVSPLRSRLMAKFAINCAVNPLTATRRCRNGELLLGTAHRELQLLSAEVQSALTELGLWSDGVDLLQMAEEVCRSTRDNYSSMLQDVLAGRETEIEYLNGELLRLASERGLPLPLNQRLVAMISAFPTA